MPSSALARVQPLAIALAGLCGCAAEGSLPTDGGVDAVAACPEAPQEWGRGGGLMLPGTNCVACHHPAGSARGSPFSVAGTVFRAPTCAAPVSGAKLVVTDGKNRRLELTSNEAGNFYSAMPLEPPLRIAVEVGGVRREMETLSPHGSCGACHPTDRRLGLVY